MRAQGASRAFTPAHPRAPASRALEDEDEDGYEYAHAHGYEDADEEEYAHVNANEADVLCETVLMCMHDLPQGPVLHFASVALPDRKDWPLRLATPTFAFAYS